MSQATVELGIEIDVCVGGTDVKIVCNQATRMALIEERKKLLEKGPESLPQTDLLKLQAGTPIGATIVPEDPKIKRMKELEGYVTDDQL